MKLMMILCIPLSSIGCGLIGFWSRGDHWETFGEVATYKDEIYLDSTSDFELREYYFHMTNTGRITDNYLVQTRGRWKVDGSFLTFIEKSKIEFDSLKMGNKYPALDSVKNYYKIQCDAGQSFGYGKDTNGLSYGPWFAYRSTDKQFSLLELTATTKLYLKYFERTENFKEENNFRIDVLGRPIKDSKSLSIREKRN